MRPYTVVLTMLMLWGAAIPVAAGNRSAVPLGRSRGLSLFVVLTLVIGWLAVLPSQTAHAANCDGLATGGVLTAGTYTMTDSCVVSSTLEIKSGTVTIEGNDLTISGDGMTRVFLVQSGATLNLNEVVVANGSLPSGSGAGIFNFKGTVTITDSTFSANGAFHGGGIYNLDGAVTVTNSIFSANSASSFGGGIYNDGGTLTVSGTNFSENNGGVVGGGIHNDGGAITIDNTTFSDNSGGSGAGLNNSSGTASVSASIFSGNMASGQGGGISTSSFATLTVSDTTFSGNSADRGGGLDVGGDVEVTNSTFLGNSASTGGGLRNLGTLRLNSSTFSTNSASGTGGGGGIANLGMLTITNGTFTSNNAVANGGGVQNLGSDSSVTVTNSTFAGNGAGLNGGGIANSGSSAKADLRNTIVADSPSGGNCSNTGLSSTFTTTTSMADDATCPGFTQVTLADLKLGGLTGSPSYFPLLAGSVAIDAGDNNVCPQTDQPGNPRPQGAACDIGSFESSFSANQPPVAEAGGPYSVDEGSSVELMGSGTDPDDDPLTYAWDLDNDNVFETPGQDVTFSAVGRDGPDSQTVVLQVCDDSSACDTDTATVDVLNVAPTITSIAAPTDPVQVGTEITATGTFTDPGTPDTHTTEWDWGDGTSSPGTVNQNTDSISDVHTYTQPGVYTITLTVTDDDADSDTAIFEFVVVYDPDAGFVTGGGWINSPAGAYAADPYLTGKAHFGFVSRYQTGASIPTGETEFQFRAGGLDFHSTEYEWLVISGSKAQYKGSGTINGTGDYGFLLTANDGQVEGGGSVDRFRIKIWDKYTDEVVYDNQLGDSDTADATTQLGGGSIVIHKG